MIGYNPKSSIFKLLTDFLSIQKNHFGITWNEPNALLNLK
jgi:hypothetical protein